MSKVTPIDLSFSHELLPDCCRAVVLLSSEGIVQVALMEVAENHGRSVTNSWPFIARHFLAARLPTLRMEAISWFEVYPEMINGRENVSRILMTAREHRFEYEQDPAIRKRNHLKKHSRHLSEDRPSSHKA